VLLRYTGQDDLVIGVPVAGRDRQETHGLVGYFINTLPVRCVAVEDASFADMVREASAATLAALDHSLLPLEEVVAASGVARVANANPLFQVLFQYLPEGTGGTSPSFGGGDTRPFAKMSGLGHAKMDLNFTVGGNNITAEYMSEIYDDVTIRQIVGSFFGVLEQVVDDVRADALQGVLLGRQDVGLVAGFSMGIERPEYLQAPLAHEMFEAIATQSPDRKCLCYEGEWLSYGEVNARATAAAAQLVALGVGPGISVGVMLDRSFELVVAILAALKSGGCYLSCDPTYPDDRLAIYLEDGGATVVLVQEKDMERAKSMVLDGVQVLNVSVITNPDPAAKAANVKFERPTTEHPAYVIFTSGSTGRPKGVMVPHRGLKDHVLGIIEYFDLRPDDVSILTITINFDPHITQIFPFLALGAGLVIAKPDGHSDCVYLSDVISSEGVTHFNSTPSLALIQFSGEQAKKCTTLKCAWMIGEPLSFEVIKLFARIVSVFHLFILHISLLHYEP
jgi:non-ribosomal peptide synthetase component F